MSKISEGAGLLWPPPLANPQQTTIIALGDFQIPYEDKEAIAAVMDYIERVRPDKVVLLGDILDFPQLTTKYIKAQFSPEKLLANLAAAREYINYISGFTGEVIYIEGNHEARLLNYILEKAPELQALAAAGGPLHLASLLGPMPKLTYIEPYGEAWVYNSFVFKHGDSATKAGAAAKELADEGSSGMSGHTHRFQVATKTDRGGAHAWYSVGCLCYTEGPNKPPGYRMGAGRVRDQQQGFATIQFRDGIFNVYPTVITRGRFISPSGRLYSAD